MEVVCRKVKCKTITCSEHSQTHTNTHSHTHTHTCTRTNTHMNKHIAHTHTNLLTFSSLPHSLFPSFSYLHTQIYSKQDLDTDNSGPGNCLDGEKLREFVSEIVRKRERKRERGRRKEGETLGLCVRALLLWRHHHVCVWKKGERKRHPKKSAHRERERERERGTTMERKGERESEEVKQETQRLRERERERERERRVGKELKFRFSCSVARLSVQTSRVRWKNQERSRKIKKTSDLRRKKLILFWRFSSETPKIDQFVTFGKKSFAVAILFHSNRFNGI